MMESHSQSKYYEKYWQNPEKAPPVGDPLNPKRVSIFSNEFQDENKNIRKILDVGCGSGENTKALRDLGFEVIGVDISNNAIQVAKEKYPQIEFQVASIEKLPFADKTFNAIYCTEIIEHIYDTEKAIQELQRVLQDGGYLFLSTPYHGFLKNLAITLFGFDKHFSPIGPHIRFFTKKSLKNLLETYGFEVQKIFCLGRFWPFWMDMIIISNIKN